MARGVRAALGGDIALSVTGIAGPGGGMPNKPVGLTWIGLCTPTGEWVQQFVWEGDREENKLSSARAALEILLQYLKERLDGNGGVSEIAY
jgi:nicotinamide mononucleotide (NMN) deamidase PncC